MLQPHNEIRKEKKMKHTLMNVLTMVTMALSAAFFATQALAQQSQEPAPTTMNTRIGELQYEVGFPTAETAQKIYDEMDFQRAVLAYQYAETLVSFNEMNEGFKAIGANEGDVSVFERFLDPKGLALTGNTTTIYAMSWLDLAKDGPMVLDMPANSYGAFFDLWQQPIMEFGPVGIDKGKGGKFLVLPIDYEGEIPEGYFIVKSRTTLA
jgi:hypothetical protein